MNRLQYLLLNLAVSLFILPISIYSQIELEPDGYFKAPGFRFLIYQNDYIGGRMGGLEMILQGKRVLDAGNVICITKKGKKYGYYDDNADKRGARKVNQTMQSVSYPVELMPLNLKYDVEVRNKNGTITVQIQLNKPINWNIIKEFAFRIEIYPEEYISKIFSGGGVTNYFYEQHLGRKILIPKAEKIIIAPEDSLRTIVFESQSAVLSLRDERRDLNVSGYMLFASLPTGSTQKTFSLKITPSIISGWKKEPVIQVSQVGYHPKQIKSAVLEVQQGTKNIKTMKLLYLNNNTQLETEALLKPVKWGDLYQNTYYIYDFSFIEKEGQYFLIYDTQKIGPFTISSSVFKKAWQPTLDVYFPTQMCHVKVKDFLRLWHGACHLDDALQAEVNHKGKDGYRQGAQTESPFKPLEHVPDITWGGWHDAGDFDLPSGSIAETALWLILAQEKFQTKRDVTSVLKDERLVNLFESDGENDMMQQIAFGVEWLLSVVKQIGHVPAGVITHIGPDYGSAGDPASITDGLLYDSSLGKTEQKNCYSGKFDDRWIYTTRNTGGQYQFVQCCAAASRLFKESNYSFSAECLTLAEKIWDYEQNHEPVNFRVAYQPQENKFNTWQITAVAELFLTTGKQEYRDKLLSFIPVIKSWPVNFFASAGFNLIRVKEKINHPEFSKMLYGKAKELKEDIVKKMHTTPYNVPLSHFGWGTNWNVLKTAAKTFYFIEAYPDLFTPDIIYSTINFVLGCHPASNHSFVSGVGSKSATVVYGFNRADNSYQPGGVISGATLIKPDFIEYRGRAWDWYQTEHVISGSAAYIFDVLATDYLLNK